MTAADLDRDGTIEVVTGEPRGQLRVCIWKSTDSGLTWTDNLVDTGRESHLGARLVDLDGDSDLDLISIARDAFQNLHLWRNDAPALPIGPNKALQ